ncbi:MAG: hypothetical protein JNJ59_00025 [Deltaproteobacteria bacterium]|nr:hypothetical protein [Deltaproteobacteria bacterium]
MIAAAVTLRGLMTSSLRLPLLFAGLAFTVLVLGLPMAHVGLRPRGIELAFVLLPLGAIVAATLRPNLTILTHLLVPVAHLPLLAVHPELTGDTVYGGPKGLLALLAVAASFAIYLAVATPRKTSRGPAAKGPAPRPEATPRERRLRLPAHPLVLGALGLTLAVLAALFLPALSQRNAPWQALSAIALGPILVWWLVARGLGQRILPPTLDEGQRLRALHDLAQSARPRPVILVLAALLAALSIGLGVFWSLWSPR